MKSTTSSPEIATGSTKALLLEETAIQVRPFYTIFRDSKRIRKSKC